MLTYVGSLSLKGIHSGINFLCARSPFPLTLILERRSSATLAFHGGQWPSMADNAALVRPRRVASVMAASI